MFLLGDLEARMQPTPKWLPLRRGIPSPKPCTSFTPHSAAHGSGAFEGHILGPWASSSAGLESSPPRPTLPPEFSSHVTLLKSKFPLQWGQTQHCERLLSEAEDLRALYPPL